MAYDEGLAERIRDILGETEGITEKKMFGGLAFLLHGKLTVGITGDDLMVRVHPNEAEALLNQPHVRNMDFTGRPMKGFLYVSPEGVEDEGALTAWVDKSRAFICEKYNLFNDTLKG